jgi:hypothetical protein
MEGRTRSWSATGPTRKTEEKLSPLHCHTGNWRLNDGDGITSRPSLRGKSGLAREGTENVKANQSMRFVAATALLWEHSVSGFRRLLMRIPSTQVPGLDGQRLQCKARIYLNAFLSSTRASATRSGYHMSTLSPAHGPFSSRASGTAPMIGMAASRDVRWPHRLSIQRPFNTCPTTQFMRRPLGCHALNQLRIVDGRHVVTRSAGLCAAASLYVLSRRAVKRTITDRPHTESMLKTFALSAGAMLPRLDCSARRSKADPALSSPSTSVVTKTTSAPRLIQRLTGLLSKRVRTSFLYLNVHCWHAGPSTDIGELARHCSPASTAWTPVSSTSKLLISNIALARMAQ